jgi:hypothetical protein
LSTSVAVVVVMISIFSVYQEKAMHKNNVLFVVGNPAYVVYLFCDVKKHFLAVQIQSEEEYFLSTIIGQFH